MITFVVGLPASGKTTYAATLPGVVFDDFMLHKAFPKLPENGDLVLIDPRLCDPTSREIALHLVQAQRPDDEIRWVFFENDPKQCLENAHRDDREGKFVDGMIRLQTKRYAIPEGSVVLPVWRPAK